MSPTEFKRIREKMGLKQSELAELFGLSGRNSITHYEMGFRNPSALIVAVMRLFDELPEKKSQELRALIWERVPHSRRSKKQT